LNETSLRPISAAMGEASRLPSYYKRRALNYSSRPPEIIPIEHDPPRVVIRPLREVRIEPPTSFGIRPETHGRRNRRRGRAGASLESFNPFLLTLPPPTFRFISDSRHKPRRWKYRTPMDTDDRDNHRQAGIAVAAVQTEAQAAPASAGNVRPRSVPEAPRIKRISRQAIRMLGHLRYDRCHP
jgi:hypothetical protein